MTPQRPRWYPTVRLEELIHLRITMKPTMLSSVIHALDQPLKHMRTSTVQETERDRNRAGLQTHQVCALGPVSLNKF